MDSIVAGEAVVTTEGTNCTPPWLRKGEYSRANEILVGYIQLHPQLFWRDSDQSDIVLGCELGGFHYTHLVPINERDREDLGFEGRVSERTIHVYHMVLDRTIAAGDTTEGNPLARRIPRPAASIVPNVQAPPPAQNDNLTTTTPQNSNAIISLPNTAIASNTLPTTTPSNVINVFNADTPPVPPVATTSTSSRTQLPTAGNSTTTTTRVIGPTPTSLTSTGLLLPPMGLLSESHSQQQRKSRRSILECLQKMRELFEENLSPEAFDSAGLAPLEWDERCSVMRGELEGEEGLVEEEPDG